MAAEAGARREAGRPAPRSNTEERALREHIHGLTLSLALLALAAGPAAAAQADGGQSIAQPGSGQTAATSGQSIAQPGGGSQIVSQPGQCVAQTPTGQGVTEGPQAAAQGAGGSCTPAIVPPPVGAHLTHSKVLRGGRRPAASKHSHRTR
jgi:hypothetical protein